LRPHWSPRVLTGLAWLGLPLGVVMCLISLNSNVPRYFIESYQGVHELGIFSPLGSFLAAGYLVVSSLGQSAVPRLARHYADADRAAFRALLLKLVAVGAALGVAGLVVAAVGGQLLLTILFRPEYAEHVDVFCWLMAVGGLTYIASFLGYGMTAARYFRAQPVLFVLVCGVTAAGCWVLVPRYGLLGAAWAMLAAAAVQVTGAVLVLSHALRNDGN
jgi:O-antigen/teichoic acid export membrane protein